VVLADSVFGLLVLGLWIFCIVDVIITDDVAMRNLQKPLWLLIVLFLPVLGSILWLVAGRPWPQGRGPGAQHQQSRPSSAFPEYDRPGRFAASNPDDDEDFLRQVRERAEEQRRRYAEQQAEQRRREQAKDDGDG
jgi:hypothetical protein